jgi:hypothetical protein
MDKIYQFREELSEEEFSNLKEEGMLEKTIEIFLEGKEIKECNECLTPNMYLIHQSKINNTMEIYECNKCNKITPYKND